MKNVFTIDEIENLYREYLVELKVIRGSVFNVETKHFPDWIREKQKNDIVNQEIVDLKVARVYDNVIILVDFNFGYIYSLLDGIIYRGNVIDHVCDVSKGIFSINGRIYDQR